MTVPTSGKSSLPEAWRVQLPEFEGPLDLLLHLIKINEVEIADIPVAVICDQFDEYLHLMEVFDLLVNEKDGSPIAKAYVMLKLERMMPLRGSTNGGCTCVRPLSRIYAPCICCLEMRHCAVKTGWCH